MKNLPFNCQVIFAAGNALYGHVKCTSSPALTVNDSPITTNAADQPLTTLTDRFPGVISGGIFSEKKLCTLSHKMELAIRSVSYHELM